jgi:UDP-N-acetylmuramoylalanine-D-glutamate ligase
MKDLIIVRGGGDLATGTIHKLYKCGFSVLILEVPHPSAIRRNVAFSEAVYEGQHTVEDVACFRAENLEEAVKFAYENTKRDGVCILSPAASSYNEYKNFEEKGRHYKELVKKYGE